MKQKVVYLQNLVQHVLKCLSIFRFMKRTSLMLCSAAMCFHHEPFVTVH